MREEGDDRLVADHELVRARELVELRGGGGQRRVFRPLVEPHAVELLDPAGGEQERAGGERHGEQARLQASEREPERQPDGDGERVGQREQVVVAERLVTEDEDRGEDRPEPERPDAPPDEWQQRERCDRQPEERRSQGEEADELVPAVQAGDPPDVGVVGDGAVPDAAEVVDVDEREDGDER